MLVTNIQHHPELNWNQYQQLPGLSFSSLREEEIKENEGMRIGTLVHKYLLKPSDYDFESAGIVVPIARELIKIVGTGLIKTMVAECPMTADFIYEDFVLPWRGIPDLKINRLLVIDFKVISGSLKNYRKYFNVDNQLRGYMLPNYTNDGLIIAYNKKIKAVEMEMIHQDTRWWEQITITRGGLYV